MLPSEDDVRAFTASNLTDFLPLGAGEVRAYQIYCDMDGVLVDFERAVVDYVNDALRYYVQMGDDNSQLYQLARKAAYSMDCDFDNGEAPIVTAKEVSKPGNRKVRDFSYRLLESEPAYFEHMPWTRDGHHLWDYISAFVPAPIILTAPLPKKSSEDGKLAWVRRHLGPDVRFIAETEKLKYATRDEHGRVGLLIDDSEDKVKPFLAAGGDAILHSSADDTIATLRRDFGFLR